MMRIVSCCCVCRTSKHVIASFLPHLWMIHSLPNLPFWDSTNTAHFIHLKSHHHPLFTIVLCTADQLVSYACIPCQSPNHLQAEICLPWNDATNRCVWDDFSGNNKHHHDSWCCSENVWFLAYAQQMASFLLNLNSDAISSILWHHLMPLITKRHGRYIRFTSGK